MPSPEEAFEAMVAEGDTLKIHGEADDTIPSSPATKSISPTSTATALRRYINKIEKSIDGIKNILDEASSGLSRRIKVVNQGSLTLAELGDLHRESFAKSLVDCQIFLHDASSFLALEPGPTPNRQVGGGEAMGSIPHVDASPLS
ncbi:hypothetical protein UA08_09138 [Talaromyces atroroseus]|uniref:Uncharacterized protein n=1 Tax=Talaromyces atroroseus TaxID=1441469 RepID=A0A1Q5Q784_TALAT|nr:hypothetical protein UA08_09138 [Talaromyces atroroseus]OKL55600.1 hypothetical protein UA08_09138 [Talaromyces atroroseus]